MGCDVNTSDRLLAEIRSARSAYVEAVETTREVIQPLAISRYNALLTIMAKTVELDLLLSAGGDLPVEWRNGRHQ